MQSAIVRLNPIKEKGIEIRTTQCRCNIVSLSSRKTKYVLQIMDLSGHICVKHLQLYPDQLHTLICKVC